ncbi:SMEK domain-containing protein [Maribacter chungangensis]|uniref:SMEK domain-containing protein n=1 Tax=Maribacter chungangensis TaxID=1069117 RepID=A0ABW3B0D9_9FLAO
MINTSIEHNLCEYVRKIDDEGVFNKQDEKLNAEDFFMRLFELIYDWKNLINLNYSKTNSPGIDLFETRKGIAIQITALQSKEKGKIVDTIEKTVEYHKSKAINEIICFFIRDNKGLKNISEKELSKQYGYKITISTTRQIIGDFQKITSPEKRYRIEEIVSQELSPKFSGLGSVYHFKKFSDRNTNQEYLTPKEAIYFSAFEKQKIREIASLFNKNKTKEYAILGNPCSGKTTLAEAIYNNFIPHFRNRTFYLDLTDPNINSNNVLDEIGKLSFYRSTLVIDNIHENVNLFNRIRERIKPFEWIKAIYLSRYHNSYREEDMSSIFNVFKGIKQFRYNTDIEFNEKASGIIDNRIYKLKRDFSEFSWYKGDFETILKNTNRNLLKLNIALETWISSTKKGNALKFDQVNNDRIYEYFYRQHRLNEFDEELLFLYSFLFSLDISFLRIKNKSDEFKKLKEKGIILNYSTSDYYYFPHKDYASLIHKTLIREKDLGTTPLIVLLKNYIDKYKTETELNITELIVKLFFNEQFEIGRELMNYEKVIELLFIKFQTNIRTYEVYQLQEIFFQSFDFLYSNNQLQYYNLFTKYYSIHKLELYVYKDYSVYSNLLQVANQLNKELADIVKTLRINEQANTNSITELTMRISKKKANPETVSRILNSFNFTEWLLMIEKLPTLSRITNSLSELNTSPLSKKLLLGIINNLNIEQLANKRNNLKAVQIAKSIRELEKIDISLGTMIAQNLLNKLLNGLNLSQSILSDFAKSLSDLSSIAPDLINTELEKSYKNGTFYKLLENEKSLSNISARILELNTIIKDNKEPFLKVINEFLASEKFKLLIKNESNINSLLIFYELVKKRQIQITKDLSNQLLSNTKQQVLNCDFDITILSNPKALNLPELKSRIKNEISTELLNKIICGSKFTVTKSLFLVLNRVDKEKTIQALNNSDINIFCASMCHKELNISQSIDALYTIKNNTIIDNDLNSKKFCANLLDRYLMFQRADTYQYNRLNFGDFLKAFDFSLKIDFDIALKHFENDFLKKLKVSNNKNLTISSLFQSLRRIEDLTESKYKKEIRDFLKLYKPKFLNGIKNEDLAKTTSGLVELSKCDFKDYADELLYDARNIVLSKIRQLNRDKILKAKIFPDIEKIAIRKAKIILTEIKAYR